MQNRKTRTATYGPWLVGLGAALWGTESAWRIPLNELFDAKVIVFWEHVFILVMFLPILISRLDEIVHELETGGREVPSSVIGARVLEKLRGIDEVAYLRYASVYQRFHDVDQFVDAIHTLGRRIKPNALQRELFPPETTKENANAARRSRERAIKDHGRI